MCCCARRLWCKGIAFEIVICRPTDNIGSRSWLREWTLQSAEFRRRRWIECKSTTCRFLLSNKLLLPVHFHHLSKLATHLGKPRNNCCCCCRFKTSAGLTIDRLLYFIFIFWQTWNSVPYHAWPFVFSLPIYADSDWRHRHRSHSIQVGLEQLIHDSHSDHHLNLQGRRRTHRSPICCSTWMARLLSESVSLAQCQ